MFIPVHKMLRGRESAVTLTGQFDYSEADFPGYTIATANYRIEAIPQEEAVRLLVSFDATVHTPCARCLLDAQENILEEKEYILRAADLVDEFPQYPFTQDGALDVQEFLYQELLLEAPTVLYCNDECEGLCQQCGKPKAHCHCPQQQEGDPRLQVLHQLLQEE